MQITPEDKKDLERGSAKKRLENYKNNWRR